MSTNKSLSAADRARITRAIEAARVVAASDGAAECRKHPQNNKDGLGSWSKEDEKRLWAGIVRTPSGDLYLPVRGIQRFGEDR